MLCLRMPLNLAHAKVHVTNTSVNFMPTFSLFYYFASFFYEVWVLRLYYIQVNHCDWCQWNQPILQAQAQELRSFAVKSDVWSLIGMDLNGSFTRSAKRNQYILTMTCYFTKWVEAFALSDKAAVSVA